MLRRKICEKINNSYPKKGELQFADGNKLPFYMIHHTAQYYSPQVQTTSFEDASRGLLYQ